MTRRTENALLERAVWALESIARAVTIYGRKEVTELSDLVSAVKNNNNVEAAAIDAFRGIAQKLADEIAKQKDIPDDVKQQLVAMTTDINNNAAALSAAITANTPSDPANQGNPSGSNPPAGSTQTAPTDDGGPQASTADR